MLVGSVKTNLGHSEAVSGITSIIKVVLALERGVIPPTIGITNLNPSLKLNERKIKIVQATTLWPKSNIRRAGVNSFGYGGANAHAILEAPLLSYAHNDNASSESARVEKGAFILPFSAYSKESLIGRVDDMFLNNVSEKSLPSLAYTLGSRRSNFPIRGYIITKTNIFTKYLHSSNLRTLNDDSAIPVLPISFVFTGQGAQWPSMGRDLMHEFPVFRQTITDLNSALAILPDPPSWSLSGELTRFVLCRKTENS